MEKEHLPVRYLMILENIGDANLRKTLKISLIKGNEQLFPWRFFYQLIPAFFLVLGEYQKTSLYQFAISQNMTKKKKGEKPGQGLM